MRDEPSPLHATALSRRQQQLLAKAPADWEALPSGVGCTNTTLVALERRGLVQTQIEPSKRLQLSWLEGWQWRKLPQKNNPAPSGVVSNTGVFLPTQMQPNTDLGLPVSAYDAGGDVLIQAAKQIDGSTLWAVRRTGSCLSKEGEWEYEPLPSNRDADFLSRCRYATPHEAYGALKAKRAKPD